MPPLPSSERPTNVRHQVLLAACLMAILAYVHRVGFGRALPKVSSDLQLGPHEAGWLTAMFLVAYGCFEMPWGAGGDRWGVRRLLTLAVLCWSILTAGVGLVSWLPAVWMLPFLFLLLVRFLFGAFQAGAFPLLARLVGDWVPVKERGLAQGSIWMATRLGGAFIPLFLGWLMVVMGNWQTPLLLIALPGLAWCWFFWAWFRNRPEEMAQVNQPERALIAADRKPAAPHGAIPWGKLFRSRSVWCLCLLYGCGGFAANFYVTLLPTYLETQRRLPDAQTNWIASVPFVFAAGACLLGGWLSDYLIRRLGNRAWGRRLPGSVGLLVGAVGWLLLHHMDSPWSLAAALTLILMGNDLSIGPAWAACADIGERHAGAVGGAMNMIGSFAGAAGNLIAGYLFRIDQAGTVFVIYAGAFVLGALLWQGVDVTQKLEAD